MLLIAAIRNISLMDFVQSKLPGIAGGSANKVTNNIEPSLIKRWPEWSEMEMSFYLSILVSDEKLDIRHKVEK